jgi:hypothetical protein
MTWITAALAILAGIGIASAAGLRAFLPLLALGTVGRLGLFTLHDSMKWLQSDAALIALAVAALLEIAGDKIPVVDHALDLVGTVLRPVAGWLGAFAVMPDWPAPWPAIVALVLGTSALAIHGLKAKTRIGSTAVTAGAGNPILSVIEDAAALLLIVLALLVPVVLLIGIAFGIWLAGRKKSAAPAPRVAA